MVAERDARVPESAPLDFDQLLARCLGNLEFAQRVLARFQDSFGEDLTRLEQELSSGNAEQVAGLAHRMKGAAANVGAVALARAAASVEELARGCRLQEVTPRFGRLQRQWSLPSMRS